MPKKKLKPLKIETFISDIHVRANTQLAYRMTLNMFERFLDDRDPTEDKAEDEARAFIRSIAERGLKETTIARHGYALNHYFKWRRIMILLELPRQEKTLLPWLDQDEIDKVVDACQTPLETAIVMVLFNTAMRIGELRGLQKKDIDWEKGFVFIQRKGGMESWIPIGKDALDAVSDYLKWRKGGGQVIFPYSYHQIRKWLLILGQRVGIERLNSHAFRHARASTLSETETELRYIKDLLGHVSWDTTLKYAQIKPSTLKRNIPEYTRGSSGKKKELKDA